jgi:hypothetical protein
MEFALALYNKEIYWKAVGMGHNQDAGAPLFRERVIRVMIRHRRRIGKTVAAS